MTEISSNISDELICIGQTLCSGIGSGIICPPTVGTKPIQTLPHVLWLLQNKCNYVSMLHLNQICTA